MKKTLLLKTMLLLFALIVGSSSVCADEVTFNFTDYKGKGTSSSGSEYAMEKADVSITNTKFYGNNSYAHFYANGVTTITPADGVTITEIKLTASATNYNGYQSSGQITTSTGSVSGSTSSTTVTWTGSATDAFTISNNKQIRWTSIVVTYEGGGGSGSSAVATTTTINASGITNTDVYKGTAAGSLAAAVTVTEGDVAVEGASVTWSGNNDDVATINASTGAVTLVAAGTVTFTASYDGVEDEYESSSDTYEMTVTDSTPQTGGWVLTDLANLAAGDVFVIVGNNGKTYALSNDNGAGSAPKAVEVTIANNEISSDVSNDIKWNISGNATDGYTFYPKGDIEKWLYCTNTNNGVRVGTNDAKTFTIKDDYLYHKGTSRYVGIYNSSDWRCYTSINSNIKDQSIAFYKYEESSSKADPELSFAVAEVNANISEQFEAPTLNTAAGFNGTVEYESSDETVAQITDQETGELRLLKEGTTTITATFAGNDNFKAGSASYTLTVTDDRIATTISVEDIVLDIADIATLTQLNPVVKDANDNIIDCTYEDFPPKVSYEIVSDDNYIIASLDNNSGEIFLNNVLGTATLKACYNAFNVNNIYKPSECTFTITVEKVMTISEARAQGEGSLTTKGVVTSCSGTTAYIQDANAAICVYGSALTVGDEVKVKGTLTTYNGLLEITSPTVTVLSQNNTMTPEVMTIYQINESLNQGWLVKIENAKVTAIDGLNTTIAQDGNTIVARGITADIAVNDIITLTGNIGCYKVAQIANPTDVTVTAVTITLADACNDGEGNYYGTYSNASAFIVPDDLTVAEVGIDGNSKLIVETYETGDIVPANTGVMVSSATAGAHVVLLSTGGTSVLGNNNSLRATGNEGMTADAMNTADNDCVFYRLTMHNGTDLGFYWGAEEGAAFAVAANKAYLAVPKSAGARIQGFSFVDVVTGISQIENGKLEAENYFDLQGRRVANPAKGLYIKNGKKVMVK